MKLKDIPASPAYLVFHDAYMNGAMDVYLLPSLKEAEERAKVANENLESMGEDECGMWRAYLTLPRKRVWKLHAPTQGQTLILSKQF